MRHSNTLPARMRPSAARLNSINLIQTQNANTENIEDDLIQQAIRLSLIDQEQQAIEMSLTEAQQQNNNAQ